MIITCPACGAAGASIGDSYRNAHPVFAGMHRASCGACGMVFATPMPGESALTSFNAGYFENAHGGSATGTLAVAYFSAVNRLRLAHVERYLALHDVDVSSVLEVGPGGAEFARQWLARHPHATYHAIESDVTCHKRLQAAGVQVIDGPDDFPAQSSFDLVILSHVLEHVANPTNFLEAMTSRLRREGVLFIEVPCRDWEHKALDEPHLLFFDKVPMARLLARIGFDKTQLSYHGQEITTLRHRSVARRANEAIRSRLLSMGVVAPYSAISPGLEVITDPLERAVVSPYLAHVEQERPAWWLRAMAVKKQQES